MKDDFLVTLRQLAKKEPQKQLQLIIRLSSPAAEAVSFLEKRGVRVRRTYRLLKAVSVEVTASQAVKLEKEDWVVSLEEDKEVRATKED